ncbi:MAG: hypothetical protein RLN69_03070 [Woeseiaceae bacterium]
MRKIITTATMLAIFSPALADDVTDVDRLLCSASEVTVCFESSDCVDVMPWELDMPQFIVIDLKKNVLSTTKASGENRSTPVRTLLRDNEEIVLQGVEAGRAFSFVIDEATGLLTVAVASDGMSVSVYGACTDADI